MHESLVHQSNSDCFPLLHPAQVVPLLPLGLFFCWRLLGLVPGGAPFSQLSSGVKDAMVVSLWVNFGFFLDVSFAGGAFFLLLAARVRSSCEEGPGQSALQSA